MELNIHSRRYSTLDTLKLLFYFEISDDSFTSMCTTFFRKLRKYEGISVIKLTPILRAVIRLTGRITTNPVMYIFLFAACSKVAF